MTKTKRNHIFIMSGSHQVVGILVLTYTRKCKKNVHPYLLNFPKRLLHAVKIYIGPENCLWLFLPTTFTGAYPISVQGIK